MKTTLILGSTVIDMIVRVPHLPVTQEDINTRSMTMALGGCSYNAARMLRLFQLPLFHCSPTGDGVFGQLTEKLLREEGLSPAVRVKGQDNGLLPVFGGGQRRAHVFINPWRGIWLLRRMAGRPRSGAAGLCVCLRN